MTTLDVSLSQSPRSLKRLSHSLREIIANLFPPAWLWLASLLLIAFDIYAIHFGHKFLIDDRKLWLLVIYPLVVFPIAWWLSRGGNANSFMSRPLRLFMMPAYLMPTMSALAVFGYLVMANNAPLADAQLAEWDKMLGLNWFAYVDFVNQHLWLNWAMFHAYKYMIQALLIIIAAAIVEGHPDRAAELIALTFATALTTLAIGSHFPSISAMAFLADDNIRAMFPGEMSSITTQELYEVRGSIPKLIDPTHTEGITQFPSFHTICGILTVYGARGAWWRFWPACIFSTLLIAATPIYGCHYFVDLIAGAAVAGSFIGLSQLAKHARVNPLKIVA